MFSQILYFLLVSIFFTHSLACSFFIPSVITGGCTNNVTVLGRVVATPRKCEELGCNDKCDLDRNGTAQTIYYVFKIDKTYSGETPKDGIIYLKWIRSSRFCISSIFDEQKRTLLHLPLPTIRKGSCPSTFYTISEDVPSYNWKYVAKRERRFLVAGPRTRKNMCTKEGN